MESRFNMMNSIGAVFGGVGATVLGMVKTIISINYFTSHDVVNAISLAAIGGVTGWIIQKVMEIFFKSRVEKVLLKFKSYKLIKKTKK